MRVCVGDRVLVRVGTQVDDGGVVLSGSLRTPYLIELQVTSDHLATDWVVHFGVGLVCIDSCGLAHFRVEQGTVERARELHPSLLSHKFDHLRNDLGHFSLNPESLPPEPHLGVPARREAVHAVHLCEQSCGRHCCKVIIQERVEKAERLPVNPAVYVSRTAPVAPSRPALLELCWSHCERAIHLVGHRWHAHRSVPRLPIHHRGVHPFVVPVIGEELPKVVARQRLVGKLGDVRDDKRCKRLGATHQALKIPQQAVPLLIWYRAERVVGINAVKVWLQFGELVICAKVSDRVLECLHPSHARELGDGTTVELLDDLAFNVLCPPLV
eukprot:m.209505 g.209505  ORF g.209505 m.209505 type:complete len:327 (+) comp25463_c0_seq2:1089-2069(+)